MKVTIEIKSDTANDVTTYEGNYPDEIIKAFLQDQDLNCVARMAKSFGEDTSEIDQLLDKYNNGELSWEDIKKININLSIGTIKCVLVED